VSGTNPVPCPGQAMIKGAGVFLVPDKQVVLSTGVSGTRRTVFFKA
jgi:hypothetical protein